MRLLQNMYPDEILIRGAEIAQMRESFTGQFLKRVI